MGEEYNNFVYPGDLDSATVRKYTVTSTATGPYITTTDEWLKESLRNESLEDNAELPADKTSVDLAKLTSEVIIKFLRSPEGINLLANELDKYFKK